MGDQFVEVNMSAVFQALRKASSEAVYARDFIWYNGEWKPFERLEDAIAFAAPIIVDQIHTLKARSYLLDNHYALTMLWFDQPDRSTWMPNVVLGTRRDGMN